MGASGRQTKHEFRPEIAGLRAVAVGGVLLFHAGYDWASGGYIGVDIFFVISGYLIGRLLLDQVLSGTFSFAVFYKRRIARLAPAFVVTLAATFAVAIIVLSTVDLRRLGLVAILASVGLANFFFAREKDYFADSDTGEPFLHLWSLAVEEQYYLAAPIMTVVLFRWFGLRGVLVSLLLAIPLSLAAAEWMLMVNPQRAFFWPFFRVWEFGLGALIYWMPAPKSRWLSHVAVIAGLLAILGSMVFLTSRSGSPGLAMLVPCLGTALIIAWGRADGPGRLLSNPAAMWLGTISYSLYLVHWPTMGFFAYLRQAPALTSQGDRIVALCLSIALGALLYYTVERRFRPGSRHLKARSFTPLAFASATLVLVAIFYVVRQSGGLPERLDTALTVTGSGYGACKREDVCPLNAAGEEGRIDLIVAGDSHAKHLVAGLDSWTAKHGFAAVVLSSPSCDITFPDDADIRQKAYQTNCLQVRNTQRTLFEHHPNATVIIAQRWRSLARPAYIGSRLKALLSAHPSRPFVIVGQLPVVEGYRYKCGTMPAYIMPDEDCRVIEVDTEAREINTRLANAVALKANARFVDPLSVFCEDEFCRISKDNAVLYSDTNHLSQSGSKLLVNQAIRPVLEDAMR